MFLLNSERYNPSFVNKQQQLCQFQVRLFCCSWHTNFTHARRNRSRLSADHVPTRKLFCLTNAYSATPFCQSEARNFLLTHAWLCNKTFPNQQPQLQPCPKLTALTWHPWESVEKLCQLDGCRNRPLCHLPAKCWKVKKKRLQLFK